MQWIPYHGPGSRYVATRQWNARQIFLALAHGIFIRHDDESVLLPSGPIREAGMTNVEKCSSNTIRGCVALCQVSSLNLSIVPEFRKRQKQMSLSTIRLLESISRTRSPMVVHRSMGLAEPGLLLAKSNRCIPIPTPRSHENGWKKYSQSRIS